MQAVFRASDLAALFLFLAGMAGMGIYFARNLDRLIVWTRRKL